MATHKDVEYMRLMLCDISSSNTKYFSPISKDANRVNLGDLSPMYRWNPNHPSERDVSWYSVVADIFHVLDYSDTLVGDEEPQCVNTE